MNRPAALIAAFILLASFSFSSFRAPAQTKATPHGQKAASKAIRFQGASQYTLDELLAAADLKPDAHLTPTEVKAHAKRLNDTGFFAVVKFSTDSKGLLFTLTPSSQLFPLHLDNLPLTPGKELDDKLHQRFPLYHGLLPASGSVVEGIRQALEEMLASQGIGATVKAVLTSGLGPKRITAVNFTVASPAVQVGAIRLTGVSAPMLAKASQLVASMTGSDFDTENSAIGLRHAFEDLYQNQGYAAVHVDVTEVETPIVSNQAIQIPYAVAIKEGGVYKLGSIAYPSDALVPRAEIQKMVSKVPAGSGRPLDLFLVAVGDAYRARGYLDCAVVPNPSFNEATRIVNYSVEVTPGAAYKMGAVQFDGASDAMAARLKAAWKLAPGAAFDASYVSGFAALAQKKDKALAKWMQTVITTYDVKADSDTHQVNCIFHFAKAAPVAH